MKSRKFTQLVWKNEKKYSPPKKLFRQLYSNLFSKNVTFTKFLLKLCDSKFFSVISTVQCDMLSQYTFWQKFRQSKTLCN